MCLYNIRNDGYAISGHKFLLMLLDDAVHALIEHGDDLVDLRVQGLVGLIL